MLRFCCLVNSISRFESLISRFVAKFVISRDARASGPLPSSNDKINPCHADCNKVISPARLSSCVSTIVCNSSLTSIKPSRNSLDASAEDKKTLNAATLLLSVSSNVLLRETPRWLSVFKPSTNSSKFLTLPPNSFARLPFASARFKSMFLVAVAALFASNPESLSLPNSAAKSSI
jgi:hypothetical protein